MDQVGSGRRMQLTTIPLGRNVQVEILSSILATISSLQASKTLVRLGGKKLIGFYLHYC